LVERLEGEGLQVRYVQSGGAALDALERDKFSCIVLDLGLPDMDGLASSSGCAGAATSMHRGGGAHRPRAHQGGDPPPGGVRRSGGAEGGRSTERLLEEIRMFIQHVRSRSPKAPTLVRAPVNGTAPAE